MNQSIVIFQSEEQFTPRFFFCVFQVLKFLLLYPILTKSHLFCPCNISPSHFQCLASLGSLPWPSIIGRENQDMQHVLQSLSQLLFLFRPPGYRLTLGPKSSALSQLFFADTGNNNYKIFFY